MCITTFLYGLLLFKRSKLKMGLNSITSVKTFLIQNSKKKKKAIVLVLSCSTIDKNLWRMGNYMIILDLVCWYLDMWQKCHLLVVPFNCTLLGLNVHCPSSAHSLGKCALILISWRYEYHYYFYAQLKLQLGPASDYIIRTWCININIWRMRAFIPPSSGPHKNVINK